MDKKFIALFFAFLLVFTTISSSFVSAQSYYGSYSGSSYNSRQRSATFQTYYGGSVKDYWPILGNENECEARQDIILQVAPIGCQPTVVRSDLLAEQNVPVFCQLDALTINPLVDISQIKGMSFAGDKPKEVVTYGYHPARAALRTRDRLLGSPLINNVGYVVVMLKQQPIEEELPDFVNLTLQAKLDYALGNAYGIGRTEFLLRETTEDEWKKERLKQSFWSGRYFARLEEINSNFAAVSIYEGDRKVLTKRVEKGKTSDTVYLPGMYCRAGLQIAYDNFVSVDDRARIEVSSADGVDNFDVVEGSSFLDGRCRIRTIDVDENGVSGRVRGECRGEEFDLELKARGSSMLSDVIGGLGKINHDKNNDGSYKFNIILTNRKEEQNYRIDKNNNLYGFIKNGALTDSGEEKILIDNDGKIHNELTDEEAKKVLPELRIALIELRDSLEEDPNYEVGKLGDKKLDTNTEKYFEAAIDSYEQVADDYKDIKPVNEPEAKYYGEIALREGIDLARDFGMDSTKAKLINKMIEIYPDSKETKFYLGELDALYKIDSQHAAEAIEFDDKLRVIRLVNIERPEEKAFVELSVEGKKVVLEKNEGKNLTDGGRRVGEVVLSAFDPERATIGAYCLENRNGNEVLSGRRNYQLNIAGESVSICGLDVRLAHVEAKEYARIRLLPNANKVSSTSNFSVNIGIEKREFKLSPEKARDKIESLNKTIQKWEEISNKLGKFVEGMKTACFATAAVLTFKNFMTGLSGEAKARQEVMGGENGWRNWCKDHLDEYDGSLDACYLANAEKMDNDVSKATNAYNIANEKIKQIQSRHEKSSDILGIGKYVDSDALRDELASFAREEYKDVMIDVSDKKWNIGGIEKSEVSVPELLSQENVDKDIVTTDAIREIMLNAELRKQGLNEEIKENADSNLKNVANRLRDNKLDVDRFERREEFRKKGFGVPFGDVSSEKIKIADIVRAEGDITKIYEGFDKTITHSATYVKNGQTYILGLKEANALDGVYSTSKVWKEDGTDLSGETLNFIRNNRIGSLKSEDKLNLHNKIHENDLKVKFYENEPYRGMPAIVPFDKRAGWYAATRQTLPAFGGIGAFDASGRVTSFWLCNVGENGRIEFESGFGDDLCQQMNLNTGQPIGVFPGMSEEGARALVNRAINAIEQAARQYGNKLITIEGEHYMSDVSIGEIGTQCQDFMSPKDCHLMFNVCDPVVCPSSRCDLGGKYRVKNVAQTGIVGSVFLCLPNIKEGIAIPVCLSGINAGIDGLVSIMRGYRDCLQEQIDTGKVVGICDEIYSIYLCDFFWNQVAPFVNVLIPKLIETAYGQGVRGGAEYLTVNAAWQNMENSIDYFTQSYAVNSVSAFKTGRIEEVGTQFCKGWASAKAPTQFKTFIEPDSPPQFNAWFDERRFTSATVPATSQYKVFFHIYAGKNTGVYYNVYLKNPPDSAGYLSTYQIPVKAGYISVGEEASETVDFTAPEGYRELCVRINEQEECGFGQVSTSFAVNYIRDSFVASEAENSNIQSESACISGSPSAGALLNPNIQAGVEDFANPAVYDRGLIRICSTQNPGLGTNPERYSNVGNCGDKKVTCWLDKNSVDDAITANNIGQLNMTLQELEKETIKFLQNQGEVYTDDAANSKITELNNNLSRINAGDNKLSEGVELLTNIEVVFDKLVWNHHKAEVVLLKGRVNDMIARELKNGNDKVVREEREVDFSCADGFHLEDGGCVADQDFCDAGFYLEDGECVEDVDSNSKIGISVSQRFDILLGATEDFIKDYKDFDKTVSFLSKIMDGLVDAKKNYPNNLDSTLNILESNKDNFAVSIDDPEYVRLSELKEVLVERIALHAEEGLERRRQGKIFSDYVELNKIFLETNILRDEINSLDISNDVKSASLSYIDEAINKLNEHNDNLESISNMGEGRLNNPTVYLDAVTSYLNDAFGEQGLGILSKKISNLQSDYSSLIKEIKREQNKNLGLPNPGDSEIVYHYNSDIDFSCAEGYHAENEACVPDDVSNPVVESCEIEDANWVYDNYDVIDSEEVVFEDDIVYAYVRGSEECEGLDIEFSIFEAELFGDNPIETINAKMGDGFARVEWNIEWLNDGILQSNPEFYFVPNVAGKSAGNEKSQKLNVEKIEIAKKEIAVELDPAKYSLGSRDGKRIFIFYENKDTYVYIDFSKEPKEIKIGGGTVVGSVVNNILKIDNSNYDGFEDYLRTLDKLSLISLGEIPKQYEDLLFNEKLVIKNIANEYFIYFIIADGTEKFTGLQLGDKEDNSQDRILFIENGIAGKLLKPVHQFNIGDREEIEILDEKKDLDILEEFKLGKMDSLILVKDEEGFHFE